MSRVAWVLNFGAEEALGRPPAPLAVSRAEAFAEQTRLLREGDVLVTDATRPGDVAGLVGRAWIPDAWARQRLASLGVPLAPVLSDALLSRVSSRRFHLELGPTLPVERWIESTDELLAGLRAEADVLRWIAKRERSCAGRGRRLLGLEPTEEDLRWVERSLRMGGLLLEPWVERSLDVGQHGFVSPSHLSVGAVTCMQNGAMGAWESSTLASAGLLEEREARALRDEVERAGLALRAAGYVGPFGVDAFRYRARGTTWFRARCEVNARYSMGWALGMGAARPDVTE